MAHFGITGVDFTTGTISLFFPGDENADGGHTGSRGPAAATRCFRARPCTWPARRRRSWSRLGQRSTDFSEFAAVRGGEGLLYSMSLVRNSLIGSRQSARNHSEFRPILVGVVREEARVCFRRLARRVTMLVPRNS